MFFANDTRDKVREENEGISFGTFLGFPLAKYIHLTKPTGAVGKELGRKWKEMTDEDKKPYNEKAAKDKKRYEDESKAYKAKQEAEEGNPSDEESA